MMREKIVKLKEEIGFTSYAAVGGYEEKRGPLGNKFDFCDESDSFGQKTWEMSEGEMGRCAVNMVLSKAGISHTVPDLTVAGDLQNQCVASSSGLGSFGIPFIGVYGACSTCTESLLIASAMTECKAAKTVLTLTTSHNSAAERQFRTPLEYGGQRTPSAQWTATAAGSFVITTDRDLISKKETEGLAVIKSFMAGRIIDGATPDGSNMGAAMAFAAADTLLSYFDESELSPSDFDLIVTGDLGKVGSDILKNILEEKLPAAAPRHTDCGILLYDIKNADVHGGASGCGTSASVLACHFLPLIEEGNLKNILFLSTGALMSPSSVLQGNNILGIAPLIHIAHAKKSELRAQGKSIFAF